MKVQLQTNSMAIFIYAFRKTSEANSQDDDSDKEDDVEDEGDEDEEEDEEDEEDEEEEEEEEENDPDENDVYDKYDNEILSPSNAGDEEQEAQGNLEEDFISRANIEDATNSSEASSVNTATTGINNNSNSSANVGSGSGSKRRRLLINRNLFSFLIRFH